MPVATSMAQLKKMLQDEMRKAMEDANKEVLDKTKTEVSGYYTGSPKIYPRQNVLKNSPKTTPVSGGGDNLSFDVYLDQSGSYASVNSYLQSLGFVSRFSTAEAFEAAESGTSHVIGNSGFWSRLEGGGFESAIKSAFGKYFT